MKYLLFSIFTFLISSIYAQDISWKRHDVNGHITGVTQGLANKTEESMGKVKKFKSYYSPNGKRYKKKTSSRKVAKAIIKAQPNMESVKEIIGFSTKAMSKHRPESELSNWFVDILMAKTEKITGKHVDVGFANFGGIRADMPKGDICRDDIMSMFPFANSFYYFTIKGKSIKKILSNMATGRMEIIGGIHAVFKDNKLVSATINGESIADDKIYGAATLNFFMEGKGWFRFGQYAIEGFDTKVKIMDAMLQYVEQQTKLGNKIEYKKDGRITIL